MMTNFRFYKPMDMHYCDIFGDCYHCPCPFCPYEKLEDGTDAGWAREGEDEDDPEYGDYADGVEA